MRQFHVADLNTQGEVRALQEYGYETLEKIPGCLELIARISSELYRSPGEFELDLGRGGEPIVLRWSASSPTTGIATTRLPSELFTLSILAAGVSEDADRITLNAIQGRIVKELHDSGTEPGFGFLELPMRPLVATLTLRDPRLAVNQFVVALADRCFAASYFRYLNLV
jgi:hypothetical protein